MIFFGNLTRMFCAAALVACATQGSAEGTVVIDNFESYSSGTGSWIGESDGIDVGLSLLSIGAIEGNQSLGTTLDLASLGGAYSIGNTQLDVVVPPSIENFKFRYRPLLGLNLSKTFTVTLTDQSNQEYISAPVTMTGLTINVTNDFSLPLANFTPPATGGVITTLKGVSLNFNSSVLSVAANEQIDSIRFTWDNSGVSHDPHEINIDFGTRVDGPNSNFDFIVRLNPADVDIGRFQFRVGYDSSQVTLTGITNNTNQPASTVIYTVGTAQPLVGYPNLNTYQTISMTATPALSIPEILAQLNFSATASFNDPDNRVWIILLEDDLVDPLGDEDWNPIPVVFDVPITPVPVSLSAFSIE